MTVLDVHPVGFDTAARVFGEDVAGGVSATVEVLLSALAPCAGMAGTDDSAQQWAPRYDAGARAAVTAIDELVEGGYRLAALLEQCAINYAGAEAACLPHESAEQSQARWAQCGPVATGRRRPRPGSRCPSPRAGRCWPI